MIEVDFVVSEITDNEKMRLTVITENEEMLKVLETLKNMDDVELILHGGSMKLAFDKNATDYSILCSNPA